MITILIIGILVIVTLKYIKLVKYTLILNELQMAIYEYLEKQENALNTLTRDFRLLQLEKKSKTKSATKKVTK